MIDLKKLTKADGQERPEIVVNGEILPVTVDALIDGQVVRQDRQMLCYQIPVDSYIDSKGVLQVGVLDGAGVVRTKAGKDLSGVALRLKAITFDSAITVADAAGKEHEQEVRLMFEPTWRGLWSSLKVVEEKA
jgi:hypothetical protein